MLRWGTIRDVTDERAKQRSCDRDRALLLSIVEHAAEPTAILDPDGVVLHVNRPCQAILGVTAPGESIFERCPALSRDVLGRALQKAAETGLTVEDERFVPALDRWLEYRVVPVQGCVLLTMRCLDEVYRLKSIIDDMTDKCQSAFQIGRVGLWQYDHKSEKVWFAQGARDFFGGASTMSFGDFLAMIAPEDVETFENARRRTLEQREPFDITFTIQGPDRSRRFRSRGGFVEGVLSRAERMAGVLIELDHAGGGDARPREGMAQAAAGPGAARVTGSQVRAARGALRWSVRELSEHSKVSVATINRFEADTRSVAIRDRAVAALRSVLHGKGIEFFTAPEGRPAIAMQPDKDGKGGNEDRSGWLNGHD